MHAEGQFHFVDENILQKNIFLFIRFLSRLILIADDTKITHVPCITEETRRKASLFPHFFIIYTIFKVEKRDLKMQRKNKL
jgi:hypothetical protein